MPKLTALRKGRITRPPKIILFGSEGSGKSEWAASAPNPIFFPVEDGTDELDIQAFTAKGQSKHETLEEVHYWMDRVINDDHDFQTAVLDTCWGLDLLIEKKILKKFNASSMELAAGGYGKAYKMLGEEWQQIIAKFDQMRLKRSMVVILLGHAVVKPYTEAETGMTYDQWTLAGNDKWVVPPLLRWSYANLFIKPKTTVVTVNEDTKFERTVGKAIGDERVVVCQRTPTVTAKNRYGLPKELPAPRGKQWQVFEEAWIKGRPEVPENEEVNADSAFAGIEDEPEGPTGL